MKKILYIDYDLQVGHVNFNRIQIDALKAKGYDVHLALHEYMFQHLPYPQEMYDCIFPPVLRYRNGHPILNRLVFLLALLLIKLKVRLSDYDHVVVGYCDEVSLWTLPPTKGMHIFMHRTAGLKESRLKRWLCQRLARKNTFLVFNRHMADMLEDVGITSYETTSHGCVEPFDVEPEDKQHPAFTIFHPSAKLNETFVDEVLASSKVQDFLRESNIRIILKQCEGVRKIEHPHILYLPPMISFDDYKKTFVSASAILLSYPESFSGQVSGISFECVANHKRTIIYTHPSLDYCRGFYNYNPTFCNATEFIHLCQMLQQDPTLQCTASAQTLAPSYSFLR